MEAVGFTAAVVQLLGLTIKVYQHFGQVKNASSEIRSFQSECSCMIPLLHRLKDELEVGDGRGSGGGRNHDQLLGAEPLVVELLVTLTEIDESMRSERDSSRLVKLFKSPSRQAKIQSSMDRMARLGTMLNTWFTMDLKDLGRAIKMDTDTLAETARREQLRGRTRELVEHFAPFNFSEKHHDTVKLRQNGTGQWFLQSPAFQEWEKSNGGLLSCSGDPGVGKTVMVSLVVDYLQSLRERNGNIGVAYVYCDDRHRAEHSPERLLGALWAQIWEQREPSVQEITDLLSQHDLKNKRPTLPQVTALITREVANRQLDKIYMVVDALDECPKETLTSLMGIIRSLLPHVNVLTTSRIRALESGEEETAFSGRHDRTIRIVSKEEDMRAYINGQMEREGRLRDNVRSVPRLREVIPRVLIEKANGMFLLCKLHLETLRHAMNVRQLKRALDRTPTGDNALKETYDQAVERIRHQDEHARSFAERVIRWVCFAERPMRSTELLHALAVEPGDPDVDLDGLTGVDEIGRSCAGLVVIETETQLVRFVHHTTKEYFDSLRKHDLLFSGAEHEIALTCITSLAFRSATLPGEYDQAKIEELLHRLPFLEYSALHFGHHFRRAGALSSIESSTMTAHSDDEEEKEDGDADEEEECGIHGKLLKVLENPGHIRSTAAIIVLISQSALLRDHQPFAGGLGDSRVLSLNLAAYWNLLSQSASSGRMEVDALSEWFEELQTDPFPLEAVRFGNALHWAALGDSADSMRALLGQEKIPLQSNDKTNWRMAPIYVCVWHGSLAAARVLLEYGVDLENTSSVGWQAPILHHAIASISSDNSASVKSRLSMVRTMLDSDTTGKLVMTRKMGGDTPLLTAVRTGNYKLFDCVFTYTKSFLGDSIWAANVDVYQKNPLHAVVASPLFDSSGPLDQVAGSEPALILKALLRHPQASQMMDLVDRRGDSPLDNVVRAGRKHLAQLMIDEAGACNFPHLEQNILNALHVAAEGAFPGVLDFLLARVDRRLIIQPGERTVLHYASGGINPGAVKQVLKSLHDLRLRKIAGPNGTLPIHVAAGTGNLEALETLLEGDGFVHADAMDGLGCTPLEHAASKELPEIWDRLDATGATRPDPSWLDQRNSVWEHVRAAACRPGMPLNTKHSVSALMLQKLPWTRERASPPDQTAALNTLRGYWPKNEDDILQAALAIRRMLFDVALKPTTTTTITTAPAGVPHPPKQQQQQQHHEARRRLTCRILGMAGYWVKSSATRDMYRVAEFNDPVVYYSSSAPIDRDSRSRSPVRRVDFRIMSHDQGFCDNPAAGNWSWFNAGTAWTEEGGGGDDDDDGELDRNNNKIEQDGPIIVKNHLACWKWHQHHVTWTRAPRHGAGSAAGVGLDIEQQQQQDWIRSLRPGARILVTPRALFPSWQNFTARVTIDVFTTFLEE